MISRPSPPSFSPHLWDTFSSFCTSASQCGTGKAMLRSLQVSCRPESWFACPTWSHRWRHHGDRCSTRSTLPTGPGHSLLKERRIRRRQYDLIKDISTSDSKRKLKSYSGFFTFYFTKPDPEKKTVLEKIHPELQKPSAKSVSHVMSPGNLTVLLKMKKIITKREHFLGTFRSRPHEVESAWRLINLTEYILLIHIFSFLGLRL